MMTDEKTKLNEETVKSVWVTLSHQVLSCVLNDPGAVFPVRDIIHSNFHWFPGKDQVVWQSILRSVDAGYPPDTNNVVLHGAPREYVVTLAAQFNEDDNRRLVYLTRQLREVGMLGHLRRIGQDMGSIVDPAEVESMIAYAESQLAAITAEMTSRKSDAKSVSDAAWEFTSRIIPTGLKPFDDIAGGLWTRMNHWVVASYKNGKSSLMRNMILSALREGFPVSVFVAEGSRERLALDCQVMLATRYMYGHGVRNPGLSSIRVMRSKIQPDKVKLTGQEIEALEAARRIWEKYPVNVYDAQDGITNLTTLRYIVKRDKFERGIEAVYIDYAQLFGDPKHTLFQKMMEVSHFIQYLAHEQDVAIVMLAQKNEEGVKSRDSQTHSPNVKGGGDAPAASDFLLVPEIVDAEGEDYHSTPMMKVHLKLSRHTEQTKWIHGINPPSGLIIDDWITPTDLTLELDRAYGEVEL